MKKQLILVIVAMAMVACKGNNGKINEPYDGGHGIGIDTAAVNQISQVEDSVTVTNEKAKTVMTAPKNDSSPSRYKSAKQDNMRGFDPASEDDMDNNGMDRYMDNYDEEGWD